MEGMMERGMPIRVARVINGYYIRDAECLETEVYYPTRKALLSAIDRHFSEHRKVVAKEIDMVDLANRVVMGEVK